ncbi:putative ATP-dependent RNA helicase DDX46 isoform X1 [Petromyzon marinus]|uniref:Probable ATP-dependent RNA helicase DDX46 n=1 Tax=Petromyzon marinus TaxID=7757 RepID=A0AAJ7WQ75_PETMA|nr:probable ATP-dependent RNA helicase DDX46 isoform X1 [Petromyzon marinus]
MARDSRHHRKRSRSSSRGRSPAEKRSKAAESRDKKRERERDRRRTETQRTRRSSRERRRSHSRERRSRRSRSRERKRSRTRSRSKERKRSKSKEKKEKPEPEEKEKPKEEEKDAASFEQGKLEVEMRKRKERIEKWREEQKKKAHINIGDIKTQVELMSKQRKKWSLEDDDEDDDEGEGEDEDEDSADKEEGDDEEPKLKVEEKEEMVQEVVVPVPEPAKPEQHMAIVQGVVDDDDDDGVDPLDAFMEGIKEEVKKFNMGDAKTGEKLFGHLALGLNNAHYWCQQKAGSSVTKVVTVVTKKQSEVEKPKGELMENDQDAMEYSSEEEDSDLATALTGYNQNKQRKMVEVVDHSKIAYEPFRRNFYVEVPELAKMTAEEVSAYRLEMEGVMVKGKGCPKPIKTWVQCGISMKILNTLKKQNYEKPTPIQAQAIPAIMSGRDLIGIAKTGSGKTIGFLLPMFRHVMDQRPLEEGEGPIGVIMTPTRELALQIAKECRKFTKQLALRVVCVYGGTGISEQIAELKRGAEIIVCTPGRMIDMLAANSGRVTNFRRATYMVLDEADRMFDMGFEPQVMRIIETSRPDRQTVMFSATFPRAMEALARRILNKPVEVQVGGRSVVCSDVEQHVIVIEEDTKFYKLLELLGLYQEKGAVIVFVDKQEHADTLLKDLMKASYPCLSLHGGIDQYDRDSIINDFKSGVCRLMVATSVAARGLDVKHLIMVVNYDCPNHYEDYVHRVGRTGRAGNKGYSYTFITSEQERYSGDIIKALELSGTPLPPDLERLWTEFREKQKAEGKTMRKSSGFSGKGFKFDETEHSLVNERKKLQKVALGMHDSDEEEGSGDIDQQIENMFRSKKIVKDVNAHGASSTGIMMPSGSNAQKLEIAKRLASKINSQRNLGTEAMDVIQQATNSIMRGGTMNVPLVSAKSIAEQLAEKINAKLNYVPAEKLLEEERVEQEKQADKVRRYEEELEINDFPQTARWKVTSKEALAQISEYSEAAITIRGSYFAPGKEPTDGERKIYLAIESTSELSVQKAKAEVTRLIKDELIRLQNSYQPINKSRYKVL